MSRIALFQYLYGDILIINLNYILRDKQWQRHITPHFSLHFSGYPQEAIMIDLHMHSYYSNDGEFSPSELVKKCTEQDISIMSIADHNTVRATDEALEAARASGIAFLPGIEIDCTYENTNFHMLGYGIRWQNRIFAEIENSIRRQGLSVSLHMLEKTRELGFDVTEADMEQMAAGSYWPETWTGEMFAEFLLSQPQYKNHPLLLPYREGGALSDNPYVNFYWDYYSQGKPCYAEMYYPDMEQIIEIIHENDGLAVLAHPHINLKGKKQLLEGIIGLGIDGIEAYSSYHSQTQINETLSAARQHGLFVTCGSDFHGKTKPSIELRQHGCTLPGEQMEKQMARLLEKAL